MNYAYDCETFNRYFCLCAVDSNGGEHVVESHDGNINKNDVGKLVGTMYNTADYICSYNGLGFDLRVLSFILAYRSTTVPCTDVKQFANALIDGGDAPYVDIFGEDWLKFRSKHFDLLGGYTLNKSLKNWQSYRGWSIMETDTNFNVERDLTEQERKDTVKYCLHDCSSTLALFNEDACQKNVAVRKVLVDDIARIKKTDIPFDYPTAKLAEEWLYAEDNDIPDGRDLGAENIVPWDEFNVPQDLKDTFKEICQLGGFKPYKEKHGMKTGDKLLWNNISYGEGGAHYAVKGMYEDCNFFDANSLYPSILVWLQLWKTKSANHRYASCYYTRLMDKGVLKEIPAGYTKIEFAGVEDSYLKDALKLILNAPTGKLRQQFFTKAQDKAAGLAMCLVGELVITHLAMAVTQGDFSKLIEVNTDSIAVNDPDCIARALAFQSPWPTIKFAHESKDGVNEHGYQSYWNNVNNYLDFFEDGTYKFKGEDGSDLNKKKHEPIVIRSLASTLLNDKIGLEESDVFEDYVFKYSRSAGVKNFRLNGQPSDRKYMYWLWTSEDVGVDVEFSAERVNLQGLVKSRHGVYGYTIDDLRPYFKYVDRNQYLEDLKLLVMIWKPDLIGGFKEAFRSKRQKSKREFIAKLPTLKYLHYRTCANALEAEKYLLSIGWDFKE